MAVTLDAEVAAQVYSLVKQKRMIDAIKLLHENGLDLASAKELAIKSQWRLDPEGAQAHETFVDDLIIAFENQRR